MEESTEDILKFAVSCPFAHYLSVVGFSSSLVASESAPNLRAKFGIVEIGPNDVIVQRIQPVIGSSVTLSDRSKTDLYIDIDRQTPGSPCPGSDDFA